MFVLGDNSPFQGDGLGSNPGRCSNVIADLAHLGEQPPCKRQVVCSSQTVGTTVKVVLVEWSMAAALKAEGSETRTRGFESCTRRHPLIVNFGVAIA